MSMELKMTGLTSFIKEKELTYMNPLIRTCNQMLMNKTAQGFCYNGTGL